ncbi:MAG: molecular chaperone HtpG [Coriobacteriales bacterium]|nr:molecular chaperone HtpG [Coriobacteriales bacterium]
MKKFKTESQRLLDLVINSIYTNREIFLRELISNASDAIDRLYFLSLTDADARVSRESLEIRIEPDEKARTLTVSDNGIGMTAEELERNLGTIARSGSLEFLEKNEGKLGEIDIIGQFGVGFYSAFMVAKRVRVVSKAMGSEEAFAWESDGRSGYTVSSAEREGCGTDVILMLKDDGDEESYGEYLREYSIRRLITRYSNYVRYPIKMEVERHRPKPKPDDAPDDYQVEYEDIRELETLNSITPIWKRAKSDVSDKDYDEFYKTEFHDFEPPARRISLRAEGTLSFDALLFIPARTPYDLYSREYKSGLALYTSNVLIMEKCEELIPDCFNFVRGVVDSADLTLNISRETLQHNRQLRAIAKRIEKRVKADLVDFCANDRAGYEDFFKNFGRSLKYGIYSDFGSRRDLLADLLIFYSARQEKMLTLDEYVAGVKEGQSEILYAVGGSLERLKKLPVVTSALAKGYDVLLCDEEVDEFALNMLGEYSSTVAASVSEEQENGDEDGSTEAESAPESPRSFPLKNVSAAELDLVSEEEKEEAERIEKDNESLLTAMTEALEGAVNKVVVSTRLTDAPVCIVSEGPISLEMEKVLSAMPGVPDEAKAERVLEVNAAHPVFGKLKAAFDDERGEDLTRYTKVLYGQALLIEGLPLDDPIAYAQQICELL